MLKPNRIYRLLGTLSLIFLLGSQDISAQFYNGSQLSFGKNRVQYEDFVWTHFRYDRFDVYFNKGGKNLATYTSKYVLKHMDEMEGLLDHSLANHVQFLVFNSLGDLKASNVGLENEDQYNLGGITHIVGTKVFLYFDGDYDNFEKQIRSGLLQIVLNEILFGDNLVSQVKNNAIISLPQWYTEGLISYLTENWSVEVDNRIRDGFLSERYKKFNNIKGEEARYAGHSIWKYIADRYGTKSIPNILFMAKMTRNVESGFLLVIGKSYKNLISDWQEHYKQYYFFSQEETSVPEEYLNLKQKEDRVYENFASGPGTDYVAYVYNDLGKYKLVLLNKSTNKKKTIFKGGHKLDEKTDYSWPQIAWHPQGRILAFITEKKGEVILNYYTPENNEIRSEKLLDFEKIHDFSFSLDGTLLALSAVQNGKSDIFLYNRTSRTYQRITNDFDTDIYPHFIKGSSQLVFSSNRLNDTIKFDPKNLKDVILTRQKHHDLFLYEVKKGNEVLRRITNTPEVDEIRPQPYEANYITYLSDRNGIYNRFIARFDSAISYIDTTTHYRYFTNSFPASNYANNILEHNVNLRAGEINEIVYHEGSFKLISTPIIPSEELDSVILRNTIYRNTLLSQLLFEEAQKKDTLSTIIRKRKKNKKRFITVKESDKDTNNVDINNYQFENEKTATKEEKEDKTVVMTDGVLFKIHKQRNYYSEFSISQLISQVDFSYLNYSYQPFTGGTSPIFVNSGLNTMFRVQIMDLLEDYRISASLRPSASLSNMEYLFSFENLKKRLDKQYIFHRHAFRNYIDNSLVKQQAHELFYILKWPFNDVLSLKGTAVLRNDHLTFLSTDDRNLQQRDRYETRVGVKGELTFDNTRNRGTNILFGTRYKVFAEYYQSVEKRENDMFVYGLDLRNYQQIHRNLIWANRFAASSSLGSERLIYYLGGVDNWLLPRFNNNITINDEQNYAYQTLATPMRGFQQNIRNGNSFAVINSELRFPIFQYFIQRPLKSSFLKNFQIIGFGDVGTAWTGASPYSDENSLFIQEFVEGPIKVTIKNQVDPIVGGVGIGLRTTLFGYFVRADWAWGVEDGVPQDRMFYLSFNLDF